MKPATLLLVDDDPLLRELLQTELVEAGFEIIAAGDGAGALAELDEDAARFKAVITDVHLGGGPNGWDIGRHARELVTGIPVVYISGDGGHEWSARGVPDSVLIVKPFVPAQLITALSMLITDADTHPS